MYIYTFLLRMTDTMISQNIELSSWNTLYRSYVASHGRINDELRGSVRKR
jgi:hypothetical protein